MKEHRKSRLGRRRRTKRFFGMSTNASRNRSGRRGTRSSSASVPTSTASRHWSFRCGSTRRFEPRLCTSPLRWGTTIPSLSEWWR